MDRRSPWPRASVAPGAAGWAPRGKVDRRPVVSSTARSRLSSSSLVFAARRLLSFSPSSFFLCAHAFALAVGVSYVLCSVCWMRDSHASRLCAPMGNHVQCWISSVCSLCSVCLLGVLCWSCSCVCNLPNGLDVCKVCVVFNESGLCVEFSACDVPYVSDMSVVFGE